MNAAAVARRWQFWVGFGVAILLIAGVVSYFASSSPDGLDSATLQGCQVVATDHGQQLTGNCIAQHATEHPMSVSPLAWSHGALVNTVHAYLDKLRAFQDQPVQGWDQALDPADTAGAPPRG